MATIGSIYRAHVMRTLLKEADGGPLGYNGFAALGAPDRSPAPPPISANRPPAQPVPGMPNGADAVAPAPDRPTRHGGAPSMESLIQYPHALPPLRGVDSTPPPPLQNHGPLGDEAPGLMDQLKGYLGRAGQYASEHPYLAGAGLLGGGLGLKALYDYLNQPDEDEEEAYLPVKLGAAGSRDFFGPARRS